MAAGEGTPRFELFSSRQFPSWLAERGSSLAFTTYQSGKLFFIGTNPAGEMAVFERTFDRPMGLYVDGDQIWLSTLYTLYRFVNSLPPGQQVEGFDRQYIPQAGYVTGDIDIHDLNLDSRGEPLFINTLFGCIATTDAHHSFAPMWQPPFLSDLAPEDRCHLNGLAMREGKVAYVTAVSESDVVDGWREHRSDGGVVIDVARNEVICRGLSMPHSPRWYRDQLWVANSGTGELGTVNLDSGEFEPKVFLPGYLRGLSFIDNWAVVGLSKPRHNRTFSGLPLDERLKQKDVEARCGLYVVNLDTGHIEHWLHISGVVTELYDVVVVPGVRRASFLGFRNEQVRRTLHIGPATELP
ncbi:TIGR03032 family protein [Ectothiorhodospiraceae bacterium BW-2]|nr:TIGR03032 family protein [Ectothiorhodospiraceae bacterium BW-2]